MSSVVGYTTRKAGAMSGRHSSLTPGELEGKTNQEYYINTGSKSMISHGHDYIPAFKGSAGRRNVTDAFNNEAAQLQDAELDLRTIGKFDKVFGNAAFEDASPSPSPKQPGAIKMNNLFEDPSARERSVDQRNRKNSPDRDNTPDKATRGPSITNIFRRGQADRNQQQGTVVEAFHSEEEDNGGLVVARPRGALQTSILGKSVAAWETELKHMIASSNRDEAVHRPAPSEGLVRCYVKRVKNFFGTHCSFQMHLDNGDVFLLAARRRKKSKVSSYVISQDLEDLKRDTDNCLAKLKANFVGTEYMLWGKSDDRKQKKGYAAEQLCINFKQTALSTSGGPRAMFVVLPLPDLEWQPSSPDGTDSLSNALEMARRKELPPYLEKNLAMLSTKPPEYDEALKAYTLDFKGRVKEASVKNFQLVHWDHNTDRKGADLVLQFGKIEEDLYALDFAYPLNVETAFSIALASIDTKLCYAI
eukprot:CAMPEP_0202901248 /NCGR_PEP_ID=MMETSP1392-20130828/14147_1 /ASSEMBLY_ACC=CAM_ASM_000868 /TAXON_ID=225041 /ORGANISM="Chlamydomonas chlamydogama, Strain SAG 11-48b" /LENGTH=473 /DNA_ID=CAMNT_0049587785 /DNA_START=24 /DNA_END=1445 /DNA_ORIENTATION=+